MDIAVAKRKIFKWNRNGELHMSWWTFQVFNHGTAIVLLNVFWTFSSNACQSKIPCWHLLSYQNSYYLTPAIYSPIHTIIFSKVVRNPPLLSCFHTMNHTIPQNLYFLRTMYIIMVCKWSVRASLERGRCFYSKINLWHKQSGIQRAETIKQRREL